MITPMRKYAFMVYHKEYDEFLATLHELGVVHIEETQSIANHEGLQEMIVQRKRVSSLMNDLRKINHQSLLPLLPSRNLQKEEGLDLLAKWEDAFEHKRALQLRRQSLEKEISYITIWGDFRYEQIDRLKEAGYKVTFFTSPVSKFNKEWIDDYNAIIINTFQSVVYFITMTKEDVDIDIDAERPKMPEKGLSELSLELVNLGKEIVQQDEKMNQSAASDYQVLEDLDKSLLNDFNMANAIVQTDKQVGDKLMFLEGWTPEQNAEILEKELDRLGFFYQQLEIGEEEKVPIQLENGKFSQLYEPITRMYSLPNYHEFDSTPLFAPFFMLFFGLCLGDAGYGLLVLLGATILKFKVKPEYKSFTTLFQYLGGATVVLGTMSGSFFGISLVEIPALQSVKDYFLNSDNLMTLSIVIGIVHILFAKCVAAYKTKVQRGTKYSIAPFAWIFVIASLVCVFGLPMLNVHLPNILVYILYVIAAAGLLIAFFYNSPGKNIFKNFGSGLWDTYNMATGLLGDTLSYIRLFAIGLTGSVLGGVFNSLAITMTESMPVIPRFIVMLLILLAGHGLSFALCMISSLVHPIRLVFVEYYKNSEFEGGGKSYLPFKKA